MGGRRRSKTELSFLGLVVGLVCFTLSVQCAVLPVKVGPSGRHLVDQNGVAFLVRGDSPWSLIVGLTREEVDVYLEDRRQKGFNSLIVNLIEHKYPGAGNTNGVPFNVYGNAPFTTPGDFSTPNEAYFAHADWVIDRAAAKGMVIFLIPSFLGYPGSGNGWYNENLSNGTNGCRNYGRFVGARYRNRPNVVWLMCGDRNPDDARPMLEAMVEGMREQDTNHLFTAETFFNSSPRAVFPSSSWLSLDTVYTYEPVHTYSLNAYQATPVMPFVLIESAYENDFMAALPAQCRMQAYSTILAGACGEFFGNKPVWLFNAGWQAALNSPGAVSMAHLHDLFLSRDWASLVPDLAHGVVTSGYASPWVGCARTSDGATVIAYLPQAASTITVDLSKISGSQANVWWFNPRDGTHSNAGIFATTGSQVFSAPTSEDWVMVLDDASKSLPAPGSLQILTPNLPLGKRKISYSTQLVAIGGTTPLSWALKSGSNPLPENLTLGGGGLLNGTPTTNGAFTFLAEVTDQTGTKTNKAFVLTIDPVQIALGTEHQSTDAIAASGFKLWLTADVPSTLIVEKSSNFVQWSELYTIQYSGGLTNITDTNASLPSALFYRSRQP